jgi:hydrogenase small subunit
VQIARRAFLKYCLGSTAVLGLNNTVLGRLEKALAGPDCPTVIWLAGANCTGCTVSLANLMGTYAPTDVADLFINEINLAYHPNLMGAAGDLAVEALNDAASGSYILAVEGGIPTAFNGHACMLWTEAGKEVTASEAVQRLAPKALAILAIGTCASFGGIPAGSPNPTAVKSVRAITGRPAINIPGCPTHPDWIVWVVAQLLAGVTPRLDSAGRPWDLFGCESNIVHKQCPRREDDGERADGGPCLEDYGCKGPRTKGDCPTRKWNNGTNWCVGANAICLGCTESGFPDAFSPLYAHGGD